MGHPTFFAPLDPNRACWVSSPESRHSRNIAPPSGGRHHGLRFHVAVGRAEAAYFDADAAPTTPDETGTALQALNARLPPDERLRVDDLQPRGASVIYRADLRHHYLLVRGGSSDFGNAVDMTVEV